MSESTDGMYQVVMDGHGPFSVPYADKSNAERRAVELESVISDKTFNVEPWPNHRQEDTDTQ